MSALLTVSAKAPDGCRRRGVFLCPDRTTHGGIVEEQFTNLVVNQLRQRLADTEFELIKANARLAILESPPPEDIPPSTSKPRTPGLFSCLRKGK
jgi:hypothetical protein